MADKRDSAFDFYFAKPTNTLLPEQANFNKRLNRTCKVGSYAPNLLGLHDMHGNVWELCDDTEKEADGTSLHAARGGSWDHPGATCPTTVRYHKLAPSLRNASVGLRVARVPSAPVGK